MKEATIVRENLMNEKGYMPYCGNDIARFKDGGCNNPRAKWEYLLGQFVCPNCGWRSKFPADFISRYKEKWKL